MALPFLAIAALQQAGRFALTKGARKFLAPTVRKGIKKVYNAKIPGIKHADKVVTGAIYTDAVNEASKGNYEPLTDISQLSIMNRFNRIKPFIKARQSYSIDKDMGFADPSAKNPIKTYISMNVKGTKKRSRSIYEGGKRNKEFVDPNPQQAPKYKSFKKGGVAVESKIEDGIKVYYDKENLLASKYLNPKTGMGSTNKYLNLKQGVAQRDFNQRKLNQAKMQKKIMEADQTYNQVNYKYDKTTAEAFGEKRAIINTIRGNMAKLAKKGSPLTHAYIGSDRSSKLVGEIIKRTDPKVKINMGFANKKAIEKAAQTHGPRGSKGVIQTDIPLKGKYTQETYAKASQSDAALNWIKAGKFKGGQHVSIGNRQVSTLDTYTAKTKQSKTENIYFNKSKNKSERAKEILDLRKQKDLKRKNMLGTGKTREELSAEFAKNTSDVLIRNKKGAIINIISKSQTISGYTSKEGITKSSTSYVRSYLRSKFKTPKSQKKNIAKRVIIGKLKKYDDVSAMVVLNKKSTKAKDMANLRLLSEDEKRLLMGNAKTWSQRAFKKFITGVRNEKSKVGNIKLFPDSLK